jgi:hypothetical protein
MFELFPGTRVLAFLVALACWSTAASAQSPVIPQPGAIKGFDPQPDPPGKEKAHVPFVAPGTAKGADQTDDKPAPRAQTKFLPPGTINAVDQTDAKPAPNVYPGRSGYGVPDTKSSATR